VDRFVLKTQRFRFAMGKHGNGERRVEDDVFRSPKAQEIRRQSACVTNALRTTPSNRLYFAVEILL
jgi:hypothetical protein